MRIGITESHLSQKAASLHFYLMFACRGIGWLDSLSNEYQEFPYNTNPHKSLPSQSESKRLRSRRVLCGIVILCPEGATQM